MADLNAPDAAASREQPTRRALLLGTGLGLGGLGVGALAGFLGGRSPAPPGGTPAPDSGDPGAGSASDSDTGSRDARVPPSGPNQAGVARPTTPQRHALYVVADIDTAALTDTLAVLGQTILGMVDRPDPALFPDGTGDLTVMVGLGQRALSATPRGSELTRLLDMPVFVGDDAIEVQAVGGDVLLVLSANDPGVLEPAAQVLTATLPGFSVRWIEHGFRGPGTDFIARNPFGFHDGVIVPRDEAAFDTNVWINSGPLAGGTTCVVRRYALNTSEFTALPVDEQNAIIGRDKATGAPLSGGELRDEANIAAKHPDGSLVIPATAHVRAAHPSFTGSDLMLRRSYTFITAKTGGSAEARNTAPHSAHSGLEQGMLFTAFQRELRTFVRTQQRLDEVDALLAFTQQTATGAFAILPGFSTEQALGATLA